MSDTVAVTGASGFIGRRIAARCVQAGFSVRALARPTQELPAGVEAVHGRLEDAASLRRLLDGVTAVVHCAGVVRGATREHFDRVNVGGVRRLATLTRQQRPTPRFLLLSSLAAREPALSPYAGSKRGGELVLSEYLPGLSWTIFRPPAVYGPGDRELLPLFRLMGRGLAPRVGDAAARFSLIHADDVAGATLAWLQTDTGRGRIYTLHDGRRGGYSWPDVIAVVARLRGAPVRLLNVPEAALRFIAHINVMLSHAVGRAPMLTPGKARELYHPDWVCDNQDIAAELGWAPQYALEAGLRGTPGWLRLE